MQITGVGGTKPSHKSKKKNKTSSKSGFDEALSSSISNVQTTAQTSSNEISPINSLYALQEVDEHHVSTQQVVSYGHDILKQLEDIRYGLLTQSLSQAALQNLQQRLDNWKGHYDNATLQTIIQEIELRAAVELAKYGS